MDKVIFRDESASDIELMLEHLSGAGLMKQKDKMSEENNYNLPLIYDMGLLVR